MNSGDVIVALNGVVADTNGAAFEWKGGRMRMFATSSGFGSGTVALQWTPDNTNWWNVGDNFSFTATGSKEGPMPRGQYRCVLTGSTVPSAVTAVCAQV